MRENKRCCWDFSVICDFPALALVFVDLLLEFWILSVWKRQENSPSDASYYFFPNNIFHFCSVHHWFLMHMLWEAFLTGPIIFQLMTLCVFFCSDLVCVVDDFSAMKEAYFGLDHARGRRRLVCKTQIKRPGWGIVLDRPLPLVNITSSAAFWTALPQLHHFIEVLKCSTPWPMWALSPHWGQNWKH